MVIMSENALNILGSAGQGNLTHVTYRRNRRRALQRARTNGLDSPFAQSIFFSSVSLGIELGHRFLGSGARYASRVGAGISIGLTAINIAFGNQKFYSRNTLRTVISTGLGRLLTCLAPHYLGLVLVSG